MAIKYIAQNGPSEGQVWERDFFIAIGDGFFTESGEFYQYRGEYDKETAIAHVYALEVA